MPLLPALPADKEAAIASEVSAGTACNKALQ